MVEWDTGGVGEYALVEHPSLGGDLHAGAGELLLYMCPSATAICVLILLLYMCPSSRAATCTQELVNYQWQP